MRIIARGAESVLYLAKRKGRKFLVKDRIKKRYRVKQIDKALRKKRTRGESRLISEARRIGILTPKIHEISEEKIVMDYIEGRLLRDWLEKIKNRKEVCLKIGEGIGKLHSANLIHGDLTTSNLILSKGEIYFIDFGLGFFSRKIEDKAVDLHLLKEALISKHHSIWKECFDWILKGYKKCYQKAERVIERILEIEKRGRYVKR
jgi:Kae1-associated kinase Bud32